MKNSASMLAAGRFKDRLRIERPVKDDSFTGAGAGTWEPVATVRAEVLDALPSRGERLAEGLNLKTRPARVRIRKRDDITSTMRFVMGARILQIVAGPAVIGRRREGMEFMVEEYSPAGNGGA